MEEDLWKDANEVPISSGAVLQLVGLHSPTHTLFGRMAESESSFTILQVLEWMMNQVKIHCRQDEKLLSATELLKLGAVWKLTANTDGRRMRRERQFLEDTSKLLQPKTESLRVYFHPSRFPAVYSVDWTPPSDNTQSTRTRPCAVLDCNFDVGYAIIHKPYGVPSHATVDNGVENVLYQIQQQLGGSVKPSLPQRLDIETEGLLLVALKPEFSSYIGRLLVQPKQNASSCSEACRGISKQYKCLLSLASQRQREELILQLQASTDGLIVEHYMDPESRAPRSFQLKPRDGWLKCLLRILGVGPAVEWISDETTYNASCIDESLVMQVRVELLTGRTHQIRGQFAAMKMPLVGDPLYGRQAPSEGSDTWDARRNRVEVSQANQMERLGLQCCSLSFFRPKWGNDEKRRRVLLPGNDSQACRYELDKAWWSDRLVCG